MHIQQYDHTQSDCPKSYLYSYELRSIYKYSLNRLTQNIFTNMSCLSVLTKSTWSGFWISSGSHWVLFIQNRIPFGGTEFPTENYNNHMNHISPQESQSFVSLYKRDQGTAIYYEIHFLIYNCVIEFFSFALWLRNLRRWNLVVSHEENIQHKLVRCWVGVWAMDFSGKHEETLHCD